MRIDAETLKQMVRSALDARPNEIGCAECMRRLDQFVELKLAGKDVGQAMPLVEHHLRICNDCREEFEALLLMLQSLG
jgi:hypothetical protein